MKQIIYSLIILSIVLLIGGCNTYQVGKGIPKHCNSQNNESMKQKDIHTLLSDVNMTLECVKHRQEEVLGYNLTCTKTTSICGDFWCDFEDSGNNYTKLSTTRDCGHKSRVVDVRASFVMVNKECLEWKIVMERKIIFDLKIDPNGNQIIFN